MSNLSADLVLEGGGVKGIGLVGAVAALAEAGYTFHRVSGTSAGAVMGSLVAAGLPAHRLKDVAMSLDYRKFRDAYPLERVPLLGSGLAMLSHDGLYKGDYARQWIADQLAARGVHTFKDLRLAGETHLPRDQRYKLVVTVSDVTLGQLVRLPWDYREVYGLDPDKQLVADAVRASMSIPFYFAPMSLTNAVTRQRSTLVDGGLLSNFPIDTFDRADLLPPRWPTFGIQLLPNLPADSAKLFASLGLPVPGPLRLLQDVLTTTIVGHDQASLQKPWVKARTIPVDTQAVGVVDFGIAAEQEEALYGTGYAAAIDFLGTWDWPAYVERYRCSPARRNGAARAARARSAGARSAGASAAATSAARGSVRGADGAIGAGARVPARKG
jgi:NTE family protein